MGKGKLDLDQPEEAHCQAQTKPPAPIYANSVAQVPGNFSAGLGPAWSCPPGGATL